ncbi:phage distal tail protein, Rcc01695 family [Roseinatronobacter sp.]
MAFHDERFPVNIARGARGGPRRRTQVVELSSGFEERNAAWADSRREFDIGYGIRSNDDLQEVVAFFEARNGRLYGFRFKDWSDYKSCTPSRATDARDQLLGFATGTTTQFQLRKRYGSDAYGYWRAITKPVAGSVRVAVDGIEQFDGWSVDHATGLVTFSAAPPAGAEIRAGFEFDVPVRFGADMIDVTLDIERTGTIASIPLIELRA